MKIFYVSETCKGERRRNSYGTSKRKVVSFLGEVGLSVLRSCEPRTEKKGREFFGGYLVVLTPPSQEFLATPLVQYVQRVLHLHV